jgi:NAD(P)-dependent dehydrogenase (short-subunit alcohol dehydrogenase family)
MSQKTAIITGGSRGLGRNMAINFARNGADVILTYQLNQNEADSAVAEIVALGRAPCHQRRTADAPASLAKKRFNSAASMPADTPTSINFVWLEKFAPSQK